MDKKTLAVCLPGFTFSSGWVSNWTGLLCHLQQRFNLQVFFGYTNNIYVTRNVLLESLFTAEKQGVKIDLVLWMDDDNLLSSVQFDELNRQLEANPQLDGILSWYWLQPHGYQIGPTTSCGTIDFDSQQVESFRPTRMYQEPFLEAVDYGGMGGWLVKWESLKAVGEDSFSPIVLSKAKWGCAGDDVSFFWRTEGLGQKYAVCKNVKLPHLKLRDADFDSSSFIELPECVKPALQIQGWMLPEELLWLHTKAKSFDLVYEIGSWKGRSSYALASSGTSTVCIDHWQGASDLIIGLHSLNEEAKLQDIHAEFIKNVGGFQNMAYIKLPSLEGAKELKGYTADMVFIDGGHEFAEVVADIEAWKPKATKLLCGHDIDRDDVRRALEFCNIPYQRGPGVIWFYEIPVERSERIAAD